MNTSARQWALALGLSSAFVPCVSSAGEAQAGDPKPLIEALEADETARAVVSEPLEHAKAALKRAHDARSTGDVRVPPLLTELALEWATTARDVLRAAKAEAAAMTAAKKAAEVRTKVERARALLAETQARRGTTHAELEQLKRESGRHGRDVDATAGAKEAAPNPAPKPKAGSQP